MPKPAPIFSRTKYAAKPRRIPAPAIAHLPSFRRAKISTSRHFVTNLRLPSADLGKTQLSLIQGALCLRGSYDRGAAFKTVPNQQIKAARPHYLTDSTLSRRRSRDCPWGIEHPACELKRTVTISKDNLGDRLDFVKLIQGLANSHAGTESLIVVGADQKAKSFVEVSNADEFDAAKISPILAKYLSPEPQYEVFNDMRASSGERYVLIVLNKTQPRPIIAVVDGKSETKAGGKTDTKVHFRPGEIWIKHNTGLKTATKADLDLMYEPVIEREAAKRARVIFEHLQKDLGPELLTQATTSTPAPELLVGSRERLARFAEAMISSGDPSRYKMLIEMARDTLVERWNRLLQVPQNIHQISRQEMADFAEFYTSEFLPTLVSLIDLGLQVIKYNGPPNWVGYVTETLIEAFYVSCQLDQLQIMNHLGALNVPLGRPAYEIYLGGRALATYAIARKRPQIRKRNPTDICETLGPKSTQGNPRTISLLAFFRPIGAARDDKRPQRGVLAATDRRNMGRLLWDQTRISRCSGTTRVCAGDKLPSFGPIC